MFQGIKNNLRDLVLGNQFLINIFLKYKFNVEIKLIEGRHKNANSHPSIIHFSMNKAATQYTKQILRLCAEENGMVPVHINEYAYFSRFPFLTALNEEEMQGYQHIFKPEGYLYSAFGGFVPGIPDLEKYKVILMIRDPRDVLVSWYYSIGISHSIPPASSNRKEEYLRKRAMAQEMSIDEHVISESDRVFNILQNYQKYLLDHHPHVYITSYEEMTADFPVWLMNLLEAGDLELRADLREELIQKHLELKPKEEDVQKHIRKGRPGDYREKLSPETIEYLNEKLMPAYQSIMDKKADLPAG